MKCVMLDKQVIRLTDQQAAELVASKKGAQYCSKQDWKHADLKEYRERVADEKGRQAAAALRPKKPKKVLVATGTL